MRWRWIIPLVMLAFAVQAVAAQGGLSLQRTALSSGGVSGGQLSASIGLPVAGVVQTADAVLCSGFWCPSTGSNQVITVPTGTVHLTYRWTFGQIGITSAALLLVVLVSLRGVAAVARKWSDKP